ncbi:MAG TPA: hypothetical protein VFW50_10845 [Streptosporangiaceae bacterium]|nr:hypothetical protein [Streptosporangiaceae bacterium]
MNGNASAVVPSRGVRHQIATARRGRGESRWAAAIAVLAASGLQMTLPPWLSFGPHWLLPALEIALLGALLASSPGRLERRSAALRAGGLALAGLLSLTNAALAVLLVNELARGGGTRSASALLLAGGTLWAANVLIFALWYWELDRGGPADRCHAVRMYPDFLFPQMQQLGLARSDWKPSFTDYLYLSFTNAISFAASDVAPLTRWAKLMMMLQSAVSVAAIALVIARAVNILG